MEESAGSALDQWRANRKTKGATPQSNLDTAPSGGQGNLVPKTPRGTSPAVLAALAGGLAEDPASVPASVALISAGAPTSNLAAWRARRRMQERLSGSFFSESTDKSVSTAPLLSSVDRSLGSPIRPNDSADGSLIGGAGEGESFLAGLSPEHAAVPDRGAVEAWRAGRGEIEAALGGGRGDVPRRPRELSLGSEEVPSEKAREHVVEASAIAFLLGGGSRGGGERSRDEVPRLPTVPASPSPVSRNVSSVAVGTTPRLAASKDSAHERSVQNTVRSAERKMAEWGGGPTHLDALGGEALGGEVTHGRDSQHQSSLLSENEERSRLGRERSEVASLVHDLLVRSERPAEGLSEEVLLAKMLLERLGAPRADVDGAAAVLSGADTRWRRRDADLIRRSNSPDSFGMNGTEVTGSGSAGGSAGRRSLGQLSRQNSFSKLSRQGSRSSLLGLESVGVGQIDAWASETPAPHGGEGGGSHSGGMMVHVGGGESPIDLSQFGHLALCSEPRAEATRPGEMRSFKSLVTESSVTGMPGGGPARSTSFASEGDDVDPRAALGRLSKQGSCKSVVDFADAGSLGQRLGRLSKQGSSKSLREGFDGLWGDWRGTGGGASSEFHSMGAQEGGSQRQRGSRAGSVSSHASESELRSQATSWSHRSEALDGPPAPLKGKHKALVPGALYHGQSPLSRSLVRRSSFASPYNAKGELVQQWHAVHPDDDEEEDEGASPLWWAAVVVLVLVITRRSLDAGAPLMEPMMDDRPPAWGGQDSWVGTIAAAEVLATLLSGLSFFGEGSEGWEELNAVLFWVAVLAQHTLCVAALPGPGLEDDALRKDSKGKVKLPPWGLVTEGAGREWDWVFTDAVRMALGMLLLRSVHGKRWPPSPKVAMRVMVGLTLLIDSAHRTWRSSLSAALTIHPVPSFVLWAVAGFMLLLAAHVYLLLSPPVRPFRAARSSPRVARVVHLFLSLLAVCCSHHSGCRPASTPDRPRRPSAPPRPASRGRARVQKQGAAQGRAPPAGGCAQRDARSSGARGGAGRAPRSGARRNAAGADLDRGPVRGLEPDRVGAAPHARRHHRGRDRGAPRGGAAAYRRRRQEIVEQRWGCRLPAAADCRLPAAAARNSRAASSASRAARTPASRRAPACERPACAPACRRPAVAVQTVLHSGAGGRWRARPSPRVWLTRGRECSGRAAESCAAGERGRRAGRCRSGAGGDGVLDGGGDVVNVLGVHARHGEAAVRRAVYMVLVSEYLTLVLREAREGEHPDLRGDMGVVSERGARRWALDLGQCLHQSLHRQRPQVARA